MGRFLQRGKSKDITLYLDSKTYKAKITNVNFRPKFNRKKIHFKFFIVRKATYDDSLECDDGWDWNIFGR